MTLFGTATPEKMPQAFLDSYKAWDVYMGDVWHKMLVLLGIQPTDTLIEVAPGSSTKLAHALDKLQFKGRLYLVDPAASAIDDDYRLLLPDAEISHVRENLHNSLAHLPENPAAILSNHPLDDMILAHAAAQQDLPKLFGWTAHDDEKILPFLKQTWEGLQTDTPALERALMACLNDWQKLIAQINPRVCLLSQYASSALNGHGMSKLNASAKEILEQLKVQFAAKAVPHAAVQKTLNANKNYNNLHIGGEILNAQNWLALRF